MANVKVGCSEEASEARWTEWSLRPLVAGLIDLDLPTTRSKRLLQSLRTAFFLLVNISIHALLVGFLVSNADKVTTSYQVGGEQSVTFSWNLIIDYANFTIHSLGTHVLLVLGPFKHRWNELGSAIHEETSNRFTPKSINDASVVKLRRMAVIALVYAILSDGCLSVLMGVKLIPIRSSLIWKLMDISELVTKIYPTMALLFFCIVGLIVADQFHHLQEQLKKMTEETAVESLRTIQRHHELLCRCVHQLNATFGPGFLLEVSFIYISVINCSLQLFFNFSASSSDGGWRSANVAVSACFLINSFLHLSFLTYVAEKIHQEATNITSSLSELAYCHPFLSTEVKIFTDQVTRTSTKITAMGFFRVGKHLFPNLIGTALTYFLIMCQFHSAEKI